MRLHFLGSGDAFGSGGRFNTCFLVEASGGRFLIVHEEIAEDGLVIEL